MQITGGAGIPVAARDDFVSVSNTSARPLARLDPAMLNVTGFQPSQMGSPWEVKAAFELISRATESPFRECDLGEEDLDTKFQIERFIESAEMPPESESSGIFNLIGEGSATGAEGRIDRLKAVLEAGLELLEAAKGPGLNLLNVAGHTGMIIALATGLRQYVGYLVEQAMREGDTPEAARTWATVALAMIGPALTLMGAVHREVAGEATWKSRAGSLFMAIAVFGSTLGAVLTGAAAKLFPTIAGGVVYIMARALAQSFFTLKDNAGPANAAVTGVTAAAYGAVQFALAELGKAMPLSGPARAAEGLGYNFGADVIQAALNALGMIADVATFTACKSLDVLSRKLGPDSVFSDPESLQQMALEVRAGVQWPTRTQLADAFIKVAGARLSFGHTVSLFVGAAAALLSESEIGEDAQGHVLNGCFAVMMMLLYFPLIFTNLKATGRTFTLDSTP
ncbi:hypothetical protein [Pseudomonas sp. 3JA]|uniref:hypothetical protein n=1 Tax=Pseudomonas sp. 3JA TaxID=3109347 RepID=UPI00300AD2E8